MLNGETWLPWHFLRASKKRYNEIGKLSSALGITGAPRDRDLEPFSKSSTIAISTKGDKRCQQSSLNIWK